MATFDYIQCDESILCDEVFDEALLDALFEAYAEDFDDDYADLDSFDEYFGDCDDSFLEYGFDPYEGCYDWDY